VYYNYEFFQELERRLVQLEKENKQLIEENKQIQEKLESLKPIHIENINYKIQELAVKELKGTLNIGMTGITDPAEIAKWVDREEENTEHEQVTLQDLDSPENHF